jgi:hypothetical protein
MGVLSRSGAFPTWIGKAAILMSVIFPGGTLAQDNHYDSTPLGSANALLAGAGLSRNVDRSAVVNNPATLITGLSSGSGISFNTTSIGYNVIRFDNALGSNVDIRTDAVTSVPGLVAGDIRAPRWQDRFAVGYALYQRTPGNFRLVQQAVRSVDALEGPGLDGNETYVGEYILNTSAGETVGALGCGYRLNEQWSMGLTLSGTLRNVLWRESFNATVLPEQNTSTPAPMVSYQQDVMLTYSTAMAQLRAGLAWTKGPWNAGLVVSAPSVQVYGAGSMSADIRAVNIRTGADSLRRSYLANTYLDSLKAHYRHPLSIGGGLSWQQGKVQLSVGAIWYAALARYALLDPGTTPFLRPASEANVQDTRKYLLAWSANRSLTNLSMSIVWQFKDSLALLTSVRSDQHYTMRSNDSDGFRTARMLWDMYHWTLGFHYTDRRSDWIAGVQFSAGGANNIPQPFSFDGANDSNLLQGTGTDQGRARMYAGTFLLSYSLRFKA